jgi:hypothetical protein
MRSDDALANERGSTFISGNAIELVRDGQADGVKHVVGRIFDRHSTDADVFDEEVLPMLDRVVAGKNVSVLVVGQHRSGRGQLFGEVAPRAVQGLLQLLAKQQHSLSEVARRAKLQAETGFGGEALSWKLSVRYAGAVVGSAAMSDLLGSGSGELAVVHESSVAGGVSLEAPGLTETPIAAQADFVNQFRLGRARLAQHRQPSPSSVLLRELQQQGGATGDGGDATVSRLLLADVEVGSLGDGLGAPLTKTRTPSYYGHGVLVSASL